MVGLPGFPSTNTVRYRDAQVEASHGYCGLGDCACYSVPSVADRRYDNRSRIAGTDFSKAEESWVSRKTLLHSEVPDHEGRH